MTKQRSTLQNNVSYINCAKYAILLLIFTPPPLLAEEPDAPPEITIDLGEFPAEIEQCGTCSITNTAQHTITIQSAKSCCAFLTPILYEKTILPQKSIPIDILIDAGLLNEPFKKQITLTTSDSQEINIQVTGTPKPALTSPTPYIYTEPIALNQIWNTNLLIQTRRGISNEVVISTQGKQLEYTTEKTEQGIQLHLSLPPQNNPENWSSSLQISPQNAQNTPPLLISIDGHSGTLLQPHTGKLTPTNQASAELTLIRKAPQNSQASQAPLTINPTTIKLEEKPTASPGESRIILRFSEPFLNVLKEKQRIPVTLSAKDCIPVTLIIEHPL